MTPERMRQVLDMLLTCDGHGAAAKGEALMELVDHARGGCPPLRAEISVAIAGRCLRCGGRGHGVNACQAGKR